MTIVNAVELKEISKVYRLGEVDVNALQNINLTIAEKSLIAIDGASGSGKTTLLNIVGGLDSPTHGKITVFGTDIGILDEEELATFRCINIGFVFQEYNLVSVLTVSENIIYPLELANFEEDYSHERALELLEMVDLSHRKDHLPSQLSGGERQRAAFARAFANNPSLLIADEPTANLDKANSLRISNLLKEYHKEGNTVIVVTHDKRILKQSTRKIILVEGRVVSDNECD
ncbi:MAG: ABC transporter ATP-binding protein [Candidatus Hodarchaeota archaeon]